MKNNVHPKRSLIVTKVGKCIRGRRHRKVRGTMEENASRMIHDVGKDGKKIGSGEE